MSLSKALSLCPLLPLFLSLSLPHFGYLRQKSHCVAQASFRLLSTGIIGVSYCSQLCLSETIGAQWRRTDTPTSPIDQVAMALCLCVHTHCVALLKNVCHSEGEL